MSVVAALYAYEIIHFELPWLPVSIIGTAVAFYVGFKNNQSYDRLWEARKIWGGIVNDSRTWGMMVDSFVSDLFRQVPTDSEELHKIKQRLVYRHIAWLYAHRSQLLVPTTWEHVSQRGHVAHYARRIQNSFGIGLIQEEVEQANWQLLLPEDERNRLVAAANTATQIIHEQSRDLAKLRKADYIDDFRHMELEGVLRTFYELQGKNERIKKFPFPRQYANMSRYFIGMFIILLPFSMIPVLMEAGTLGLATSVVLCTLIGWVYIMMEVVGDYSENPFQGMANDIPMLSLCRTIEIDMREMLGETDLPKPIQAKDGVLL